MPKRIIGFHPETGLPIELDALPGTEFDHIEYSAPAQPEMETLRIIMQHAPTRPIPGAYIEPAIIEPDETDEEPGIYHDPFASGEDEPLFPETDYADDQARQRDEKLTDVLNETTEDEPLEEEFEEAEIVDDTGPVAVSKPDHIFKEKKTSKDYNQIVTELKAAHFQHFAAVDMFQAMEAKEKLITSYSPLSHGREMELVEVDHNDTKNNVDIWWRWKEKTPE